METESTKVMCLVCYWRIQTMRYNLNRKCRFTNIRPTAFVTVWFGSCGADGTAVIHKAVTEAVSFFGWNEFPKLHFYHEADLFCHFDRAHTEQAACIDNADAAQLHEVADIFR